LTKSFGAACLGLTILIGAVAGCTQATQVPPQQLPPTAESAVDLVPQPTSLVAVLADTATPGPTATPMPSATPPPSATFTPPIVRSYRVAFVPDGEQLDVRAGAGTNHPLVGTIPPNVAAVQSSSPPEADWVEITWQSLDGWTMRQFLTEEKGAQAFCSDAAARRIVDDFKVALQGRDGPLLARLVHPKRGLLVRLNWWNPEVRFSQPAVETVFNSDTSYDWGVEDGSGQSLVGSFKVVVQPLLEADFSGTPQVHCNNLVAGGSAGIIQLPFEYSAVNYYAIFRPPAADSEFDWGTWVLGIEYWSGKPYLSFLVHYEWEI
jgi:hypothetical protein